MEKALSRRSLVRGSAWAAPIILTGATVPAYAASIPRYCETILMKPGSIPGRFSLTFPTTLERLYLSVLVGGGFVADSLTDPWWVLTGDRKTLIWQPNIYPQTEPLVTLDFAVETSQDRAVVSIDALGCPSMLYDSAARSTQVTD